MKPIIPLDPPAAPETPKRRLSEDGLVGAARRPLLRVSGSRVGSAARPAESHAPLSMSTPRRGLRISAARVAPAAIAKPAPIATDSGAGYPWDPEA
jgi:hypothetical protein